MRSGYALPGMEDSTPSPRTQASTMAFKTSHVATRLGRDFKHEHDHASLRHSHPDHVNQPTPDEPTFSSKPNSSYLQSPAVEVLRRDSDLGRPSNSSTINSANSDAGDMILGLSISLLFICASAAYHDNSDLPSIETKKSWTYILISGYMIAGILLSCGVFSRLRTGTSPSMSHSADPSGKRKARGISFRKQVQTAASSIIGLALPLIAAALLGGSRVSLVILSAIASGFLTSQPAVNKSIWPSFKDSKALWVAIALCTVIDVGLTLSKRWQDLLVGYFVLILSITTWRPPFFTLSLGTIKNRAQSKSEAVVSRGPRMIPTFIATKEHCNRTISAGVITIIATVTVSIISKIEPIPTTSLLLILCACIASVSCVYHMNIGSLRSTSYPKPGFICGLLITAVLPQLISSRSIANFLLDTGLAFFAYGSVFYDVWARSSRSDHAVTQTGRSHSHHHIHGNVSSLTAYILSKAAPGSLIHEIICEKDSRRIAYFTCLNFCFMLIQGFYGWASGSLGLLSDTVHMFFDCLALIIGLAASVASKWPTSPEKPYGWGKLNTLAGFGNGIFLMLVSIEFIWGAIEGILDQTELRRVGELLVVSTLGLIVNMVGLLAFGHAHAGHSHGHGHDHHHHHHDQHQIHHQHSHEHIHQIDEETDHHTHHDHHDHHDHHNHHHSDDRHDHDHKHDHDHDKQHDHIGDSNHTHGHATHPHNKDGIEKENGHTGHEDHGHYHDSDHDDHHDIGIVSYASDHMSFPNNHELDKREHGHSHDDGHKHDQHHDCDHDHNHDHVHDHHDAKHVHNDHYHKNVDVSHKHGHKHKHDDDGEHKHLEFKAHSRLQNKHEIGHGHTNSDDISINAHIKRGPSRSHSRPQVERRPSLYPPKDAQEISLLKHNHSNDNMHGIYLHIAADAGGSLAVILSTTLTLWKPWYLWDPLATIVIAALIFMAAVPLVKESGRKLLLVIPDEQEYLMKETLQELGAFYGVLALVAPRFWLEESDNGGGDDHHHHHGHDHGHGGGNQGKIVGVIHVIAAQNASIEDVQVRIDTFFKSRNMDVVVQVEKEGDGGGCWCGG